MRVVLVGTGHSPIPPNIGRPIEKLLYYHATNLAELGCEVHLVDISARRHLEIPNDIVLHEVRQPPVDDRLGNLWLLRRLVRNPAFALQALVKIREILGGGQGQQRATVIHCHTQTTAAFVIAAKSFLRWKTPVVYTIHNHDYLFSKNPLMRLLYILETISTRTADLVIAETQTASNALVARGVRPDRVGIVAAGVEKEDIEDFVKNTNHGVRSSKKRILCPGRIVPTKNQLTLIRCLPRLLDEFDAELIFPGAVHDREYLNELMKWVEELGLRRHVVFAGDVPRSRLFELFLDCDVVVLPSYREIQGVVLLEAFAFGVPVVCANIGAFKDLAQIGLEPAAVFVDPYNVVEMSRAIVQVLKDKELCSGLVGRGKDISEAYAWPCVVKRTLALYEKLVGTS